MGNTAKVRESYAMHDRSVFPDLLKKKTVIIAPGNKKSECTLCWKSQTPLDVKKTILYDVEGTAIPQLHS
jgi:hypothetical protein